MLRRAVRLARGNIPTLGDSTACVRALRSRGTSNSHQSITHSHSLGPRASRSRPLPQVGRANVPVVRHPSVGLHTSPHSHAPYFLAFFLAPVSRFVVAIGGRLTRSWWKRLPPERKQAIRASMARRKNYIYGGLGIFALSGVGYYYTHIEATPITGRQRFVVFSRDDVLAMIEDEREQLVKGMCQNEKAVLRFDHPAYVRVQSIVSNILASNKSPEFDGFEWSLHVIDKPDSINALCLPTGDIFVFTGLVQQCRSDEELAFILSHEIAHAVLGHGVEALTHNGITSFLSLLVIALIWAVIPNDLVSYFLHGFSRSTVEVMLEHPHSRKLETEADKVCIIIYI